MGGKHEQDYLSYENEQRGIQEPTNHKTKETGFAVLTSVDLRDHQNKMRSMSPLFRPKIRKTREIDMKNHHKVGIKKSTQKDPHSWSTRFSIFVDSYIQIG